MLPLALAVLAVVFVVLMLRPWADVPCKKKWPSISEDEFIRRCSPGVDRERALKVRRIISEQLGVDYGRVYPEQKFVEDLGCD